MPFVAHSARIIATPPCQPALGQEEQSPEMPPAPADAREKPVTKKEPVKNG